MPDLAETVRQILLLVRLVSCPDALEDHGGVRCTSEVAARLAPPWSGGEDEGVAFLLRVAQLESTSRPMGVHAGDARLGRYMWERAAAVGWLDPKRCPGHRLAAGGRRGEGWAPRSAWGVSAAYSLRHVGALGCWLGPAVLDVPAIGAYAAAAHARRCVRRGARTAAALRVCWAGKRKAAADVLRRWRG